MKRHAIATEHDLQTAVFDWRDQVLGQYPDLALLHAVPNGGSRGHRRTRKGKRYSPEGQRMKREGVTAGVPDIHLPVGRGGALSLYLEMKRPGGKPTELQQAWIAALQRVGNAVMVCHSVEEAIEHLQFYLDLPPTVKMGGRP